LHLLFPRRIKQQCQLQQMASATEGFLSGSKKGVESESRAKASTREGLRIEFACSLMRLCQAGFTVARSAGTGGTPWLFIE